MARVIAGVPAIGEACDELRKAGWHVAIAANRITVNDDVYAQLVVSAADAWWVVHGRPADVQCGW